METLLFIVVLIVALLLALLPVKWAAKVVGARRHGFGWCFLALTCASILHGIGIEVPVAGSVVAFLLSAAGFAAILGTSYPRGIVIAILHTIFTIGLVVIAILLAGLGLLPFAIGA